MAVRVMDKAITWIARDTTDDIRRFFYGKRRAFYGFRGWNALTRNSDQFRFTGDRVHFHLIAPYVFRPLRYA